MILVYLDFSFPAIRSARSDQYKRSRSIIFYIYSPDNVYEMCTVTYSAVWHSFPYCCLYPFWIFVIFLIRLISACIWPIFPFSAITMIINSFVTDVLFASLKSKSRRDHYGRTREHKMPMFPYLPRLSPALYERWSPPKSGTFLRLRVFIVASMELFHYRGTDVFRCSFHR